MVGEWGTPAPKFPIIIWKGSEDPSSAFGRWFALHRSVSIFHREGERTTIRPTRTESWIMKDKDSGKFFVGLSGVALVVTYLIWTGVSETMVYYLTPVELMTRVEQDPTFFEVGVKVSGRVERGSWNRAEDELLHHFTVVDLLDESVRFPVEYRDILPDTFNDTENVDVVVEGRFREDGVFEATVVLAKCGSRYEATPEELLG